MIKTRRILFIAYNQFAHLDMAGPASVFDTANNYTDHLAYDIKYLSIDGGIIQSQGGPPIITEKADDIKLTKNDTILVVGAAYEPIKSTIKAHHLPDWLKQNAPKVERIGSVCSGSFILAAAGLLDGKNITTHWNGVRTLQKQYPNCHVNGEALYIEDNGLWTSAGVTTGIDMSLAIIKRDHNATLTAKVAKYLVVYSHRPGTQSQFSDILKAQVSASEPFSSVVNWALNNLDSAIRVSDLANKATMSERTFYRKFTQAMGQTPSKFLEGARLEKAKSLLEADMPVKVIASKIGFQSEAGFRAAFEARFGISPSHHRRMHVNF